MSNPKPLRKLRRCCRCVNSELTLALAKGAQMVRYYGWYSNKMRGVRHRGLPPELIPHRPGVSPPPPLNLPSKKWRDLILRVWHVDPVRCPVLPRPDARYRGA